MKRNEKGIITVEMAMLFPIFFTIIFMWAELCFMSYVASLGDYAISEASRTAKSNYRRSDGLAAYSAALESALNGTTFGNYFAGNFDVDVQYLLSDELDILSAECGYETDEDTGDIENTCEISGYDDGDTHPVAVYHITYNYDPIFASLLLDNTAVFDREVIAVQEYERCDFDTTGNLNCG